MSACMYVCIHVYIAWKKKDVQGVWTYSDYISHIKTTIIMYNDWKYIFKKKQ